MADNQVTVTWLSGYGSWKVRTRGIPANDRYKDTKEAAVRTGKNLAKRYEALLVVMRKDGSIQNENDYRDMKPRGSSNRGYFG